MVYIKLSGSLYPRLKNLIEPTKLVNCDRQFYIPYPQFKRIAMKHNMQLHKEIGRHDIITYSDMELIIAKDKQTPQEKRMIQDLKNKSQMRRLKMNSSKNPEEFYFQAKKENPSIKEMTQTISYSMAFLFSFFMAGFTGYCVGNYFLGWEFVPTMILALVFIIFTIVIDTTLFIIRQYAKDSQSQRQKQSQLANRSNQTRFNAVVTGGKDKKE